MEAVTLKPNHPTQFQVLVGRALVAYVCKGRGMPINWLPRSVTSIELTTKEQKEVAEQVRDMMDAINSEIERDNRDLLELSSGDYVPKSDQPQETTEGDHE